MTTHANSTLRLVAIAFALFAYILLFERHTPGTVREAAQARLLFPDLDPARVDRVEISRTNATIRAERGNGQWRLTDPLYPAQAMLVDNWLDSVARLDRGVHISAGELLQQPGSLGAFGLATPEATVAIDQGSKRYQFKLGSRTPMGARMYLQRIGSDGVEITGALPLDRLPASASDWRDPAFLDLAGMRFDRFRVRAATREFEVQRELTNRLWRLTRPRSARADTGRIDQMLQRLQSVRVAQFANDFPTADLEPYGLQAPQAVLTFSAGTNALLTVEFGRSPTNAPGLVFARRSSYPGVLAVPRPVLDLVAQPYTEVLDYQFVDFPLESVDRVDVRSTGSFSLQRQAPGGWRVVEPQSFAADPALVQGFLGRLRSMRIAEVVKEVVTELDLPTYGLSPPVREYVIQWPSAAGGVTNAAVLRLDFGTNQADRVFARRTDENSVYAVKRDDFFWLPEAAFELRDRRIWNYTTNQFTGVAITQQGVTRKFARSPSGRWTVAADSQGMVNTLALEVAMQRLGQLRAMAWVAQGGENPGRYGITAVAHRLTVEVTDAGKTDNLTIDFGATSPSGGPFAAITLDGQPTIFEFPLEIYQPYADVLRSMASASRGGP